MKTYKVAYCLYDPGNFFGYRMKSIEAESVDEAEVKFHEWSKGLVGKGKWEYQIMEPVTAPRIYDSAKGVRL